MYYLVITDTIEDNDPAIEAHATLNSAKDSADEFDNEDFTFTILQVKADKLVQVAQASQAVSKLTWK